MADQRDDPDRCSPSPGTWWPCASELAELREGDYRELAGPEQVWAFVRGGSTVVALNLGDGPAAMPGVSGRVRAATRRGREGEAVDGRLELAAWEAVVVTP